MIGIWWSWWLSFPLPLECATRVLGSMPRSESSNSFNPWESLWMLNGVYISCCRIFHPHHAKYQWLWTLSEGSLFHVGQSLGPTSTFAIANNLRILSRIQLQPLRHHLASVAFTVDWHILGFEVAHCFTSLFSLCSHILTCGFPKFQFAFCMGSNIYKSDLNKIWIVGNWNSFRMLRTNIGIVAKLGNLSLASEK